MFDYHTTFWEFFTPTLGDVFFSLEFEWQQAFKSPGLFSVVGPFLGVLLSGWSQLVLWFLSLPVILSILWGLFQVRHLRSESPSLSCSLVFLVLNQGLDIYHSFRFFKILHWGFRDGKVHYSADFLFFCGLLLALDVWPKLGDTSVFQNSRKICASYSPGQILGCAYTTY